MINDKRTYNAYLLRLWRVNTGRAIVWHASLEDSRTGELKGFADLKAYVHFWKSRPTMPIDAALVKEVIQK